MPKNIVNSGGPKPGNSQIRRSKIDPYKSVVKMWMYWYKQGLSEARVENPEQTLICRIASQAKNEGKLLVGFARYKNQIPQQQLDIAKKTLGDIQRLPGFRDVQMPQREEVRQKIGQALDQ